MSNVYHPKRTIHMPPARSQQIALAAASLDITSEDLIQAWITAGLLTMAEARRTASLCACQSWRRYV